MHHNVVQRIGAVVRVMVTVAASLCAMTVHAQDQDVSTLVPQIWQLLDYMAADYEEAVQDGVVIDEGEFQEQVDFARIVREQLQSLPDHPQKATLIAQAQQLLTDIESKEERTIVTGRAHTLNALLVDVYPVVQGPATTPDVTDGKASYRQYCASCHGETGAADGPGATPDMGVLAFDDPARADQRSPQSLYQTITQGVDGTAMVRYDGVLTDAQRWNVAYYVSTLAYQDSMARGRRMWEEDPIARATIQSLDELTRIRAEALVPPFERDDARALVGYLRAHPDDLRQALQGIPLARARAQASVQRYEANDRKGATQMALSAYLDGVEPVEALLDTRDRPLRSEIELHMGLYRTAIAKGATVEDVRAQAAHIDELLVRADTLLADHSSSAWTIFVAAWTILFREGLEALLVIVALLAFLETAKQHAYRRYIHIGWIAAVAAGVATWFVAQTMIVISGASRELTEGLGAIFAVIMLLFIGLWMHQKSMAGQWQAYIRSRMQNAMTGRTAWLLFVLAFVTVYREIFEMILFYTALWDPRYAGAFLGGIALAIAVLAAVAAVMLRTSRRLPIHRFFQFSSALMAILCFVLAGKGIAALQEAGWVHVHRAPLPHLSWFGMYPTWETSVGQWIVLLILIGGVWWNHHRATREIDMSESSG